MTNREFILATLLPYKENPDTCAFGALENQCLYLMRDDNGTVKHCAVGKWLLEPSSDKLCSVKDICDGDIDTLKKMLKPDAAAQNLPIIVWLKMQNYHDLLAESVFDKNILVDYPILINNKVKAIEDMLEIKLPELYVKSV